MVKTQKKIDSRGLVDLNAFYNIVTINCICFYVYLIPVIKSFVF